MNMLLNPGFSFFGLFDIKWYGVIMACAMIIGIFVAIWVCKVKGYNTDIVFWLAICVLPLAVIGARLYWVAFYGVDSFWDIFKTWEGGMAIYGGVIGGFLGILLYMLITKENLAKLCDIAAPALILGQAIGRWGNFVNQEAYGPLVTNPSLQWFPFSVYITAGVPSPEWHYATFFYESLWNIIGFIILMILVYKIKQKGIVTSVYLMYYGLGRVLIEGLRTDSLYLWNTNIRVSQLLSGILMVAGLIMLICIIVINKRRRTKNE